MFPFHLQCSQGQPTDHLCSCSVHVSSWLVHSWPMLSESDLSAESWCPRVDRFFFSSFFAGAFYIIEWLPIPACTPTFTFTWLCILIPVHLVVQTELRTPPKPEHRLTTTSSWQSLHSDLNLNTDWQLTKPNTRTTVCWTQTDSYVYEYLTKPALRLHITQGDSHQIATSLVQYNFVYLATSELGYILQLAQLHLGIHLL